MVVYTEVFIAENFLMNYIVTFLAAKLLRENVRYINLILSASVGCFYAFLVFPMGISSLENIFAKLIFSLIMCICVVGIKEYQKLLKMFFAMYLSTLLTGGVLLFEATGAGINISLKGGAMLSGTSFSYMLLIFFVFIIGFFYVIKYSRKIKLKKSFIYDVLIMNGGITLG